MAKDRRIPDSVDKIVADEMKGGGMSQVSPAPVKPRPKDPSFAEGDDSGQQFFTKTGMSLADKRKKAKEDAEKEEKGLVSGAMNATPKKP